MDIEKGITLEKLCKIVARISHKPSTLDRVHAINSAYTLIENFYKDVNHG